MSELPTHPDLDQLRRQARELQRGSAEALTLAQAQHAVARRYGFASWPRLKHHVEATATGDDDHDRYRLRYVRTPDELRALWTQLFRIHGEPDADPDQRAPHWRIFDRFDEQRHRMLVVEHGERNRIVGGALGLHLLGLEPDERGKGLGRRLLETAEAEAIADGATELHVHATAESTPFFRHLGYHEHGASHLHLRKGAPTGKVRDVRLQRWRAATGDLERGITLVPDPSTGRVAPQPW